jgi:hypothetical protein
MPIFKMEYPIFTDFNPSCSLNGFLQTKFNTNNTHQYRYYLQQNADNIQKYFAKCAMRNYNECVTCPMCQQALQYHGEPLNR